MRKIRKVNWRFFFYNTSFWIISTWPSDNNPKGGIVEKESPINLSNLSHTTKDGSATKIGYRVEDGKKVRFSKKTNEII